jgi:hypothetical protein
MNKLIAITIAAGFASAASAGVLGSGNLETFADSNVNGDAPASATTLGSGRTYTVRSGGVVGGTTGIRFMPIEGSSNGTFAGWGLIEFDPTEALAQIQSEVDTTAGATGFVITGATLTAQQQESQPFSPRNGLLDIYHVSDDVTNPFGLSGASFTNQLGGASLVVDSFNYVSQPSNVFAFDSGASVDYSSVLADWNGGTDLIRMIINPGDSGVVAPFKGSSSPFAGINAPSFRLDYQIIPAPGAAALFGLAGLTASRRRRG